MDLHHSSLGYSLLDWHILDGDYSNGICQEDNSNGNGLVPWILISDIWTSNTKSSTNRNTRFCRRTVTRTTVYQVGQKNVEVICTNIDESKVSNVGQERVQGIEETMG